MNYFSMICQESRMMWKDIFILFYGESLKKRGQCMEWLLEVWVQVQILLLVVMISGGLGLRQLGNRVSVSSHRLKSSSGSESPGSCQLDQWPVTRPWLCRNDSTKRWKEAKQVFLGEKGMWTDSHGGLTEFSCPPGGLWLAYIEHSMDLFDQSSCFAWFWV